MILSFDYVDTVGTGHCPQVVHLMDNGFEIIYLDNNGFAKSLVSYPNLGLYDNLSWKKRGRMSPDENISHPSLKKVAHHGAYGFWSADGINDSTDHKFVMYMLPFDVSDTLLDGKISHTKDSAVSSANFTFQNVNLLNQHRSLVSPNTLIELYFSMGNSKELPIGKWYVDRISTSFPNNDISVTARNTIGKLLKEQTFDENNTFELNLLIDNLKAILDHAGVVDYFVSDCSKPWNLAYNPSDTILSGIEDIIQLLPFWKIEETTEGVIGIGDIDDARFDQPTVYEFERDKTCWNYDTEYSDENTYAKVCVHCKEPANTVYINVPFHKFWVNAPHKTLHISVPDGTNSTEMQDYGYNLAEIISLSGRIETFVGRFMPQLIIGDEVDMVANGETQKIGTVTSLQHNLGRKGFYTSFTVDSAGRKSKPMLKDYLSQLTNTSTSSAVITEENGGI